MKSDDKSDIPYILKVDHWDADLPIGDWNGPDPLPLYPSLDRASNSDEVRRALREQHIQYQPTKDQNLNIINWVNENIPEKMKWLFPGLEINHVQFQKLFWALPAAHVSSEADDSDFKSQHPEVFENDWDVQLDRYRFSFLQYLKDIGCSFHFVSENEALDNGMLNIKGYERPRFLSSPDFYMGTSDPPKKLWKYLTTSKFLALLQNQTVWFSRPQFFDDPHEFTMDLPSQRNLFQWKLDSFAREYNRAIVSRQTSYVSASAPLVAGLELDDIGKIKNGPIRLSQLSNSLLASIKKNIRTWQESFCISCWRYSPYDSVAIWNQYATLKEGVAIVADLESLRKSFQEFGDIRMATIEYRDFSDESVEPMTMNPLVYKDIRFSSEEEARFYFRANLGNERGFAVLFKFSDVVTAVHLPPNCTAYYKCLVSDVLTKYGFNMPINESSLSRVPSKF